MANPLNDKSDHNISNFDPFYRTGKERLNSSGYKINFGGIFSVIIIALLAIAVIRILSGRQLVTFTGLFQQLSKAPTIPTSWLSVFSTNFGETFPWGLQWLGDIIDFFSDLLSFGMYTGTAALNALSFFFYFLRWIFV